MQSNGIHHRLRHPTRRLSWPSFRHEPEPFWEVSERCLLFADLEEEEKERSSVEAEDTGVFINPYVRAAYSQRTWRWLDFFRRFEWIFANLQAVGSIITYQEHSPRRVHIPGQRVLQEVWKNADDGRTPGGSFEMIETKARPGGFCGQRRMFVMKKDIMEANQKGEKNWEKIPVPHER